MSLREEQRALTRDEMEEVWHTMGVAAAESGEGQMRDARTVGVCLEMVREQMGRGGIEVMIDEEVLTRIEEGNGPAA